MTTTALNVGDRVLGYSHPSRKVHLAIVTSRIGDEHITASLICGRPCTAVAPRSEWRASPDICGRCHAAKPV